MLAIDLFDPYEVKKKIQTTHKVRYYFIHKIIFKIVVVYKKKKKFFTSMETKQKLDTGNVRSSLNICVES